MATIEEFRRQQRSLNRRTADLQASSAGSITINGRFLVNYTGEAIKHIIFPVKFFDIPSVKFNFEIVDLANVTSGLLPELSAHVSKWAVEDVVGTSRYYVGMDVRVVSFSPVVSKFAVQWTASGPGFRNLR